MIMRNKTILCIGGVLALLNLLAGLILSNYDLVNIAVTTVIIIITTVVLLRVNSFTELKDGFKVSLNFIIPTIGIIQYIFALFMPNRITDNWYLIILLILLAFEMMLLLITKSNSN